ncbi:MAG: AAA family ATPase [Alphaproteobacteria bacterium]|nr:AAA family ATPase [Alphaproteobacteria bacterium]
MVCPRCHAATADGARFCGSCGADLASLAAPSPERRQLSVLFCDLVDSTALSVRLDPEDLREVILAYQQYVSETVDRFGGFVAQRAGDGLMVLFGWPRAHEHDPERAVRAGLALVAGLAARSWPCDVVLEIRVGIATGLVLVEPQGVVGDTPNLAARLQTQAEPNTVVIGPATQGLVRGLFDYRDLGPRHLKGFAEPVRPWQVLRESRAVGRFEALHGTELGPLLGRDAELALLLGHWRQAKRGEGRVVLLSGEPGIGKSRLVRALLEGVADEPHARMRHFCAPHHTDSALHPIATQLERAARFAREDDPGTKRAKLQAMLSALAVTPDDGSLIAELLGLAGASESSPRPGLAPMQRRQRTLDALKRLLEASSRRQPILAVFEDVHWCDPTSLELLQRVLAELPRLPILFVVTARPDFAPPWLALPHAHVVALGRLDRAAAAALVESASGPASLDADRVREILDQTDGVPLFIEELTRAVVEAAEGAPVASREGAPVASREGAPVMSREGAPAVSREGAPVASRIPTTLQASLMSRLDRLGPAKELAQLGAVIGRRFSWPLLAIVAGRSEQEMAAGLEQLIAAGLLFQEGQGPHRSYRFKHALVQSAAYESLLRSARQQLHARIARALEARFPATPAEQVAGHWAEAGERARAAAGWQKAGEQAIRRGANREAIAQLGKGLAALERLPPSAERDRSELALQLLLAEALIADRGWTAAETQPCWARARVLCERIGEPAALFPILYGQFSNHLSRGEPDVHDLAAQALQLTRDSEAAGLRAVAHAMAGMSHFARGEFLAARTHLESALLLSVADRSASTFLTPAHNAAIASLWLAMTVLVLGRPDEAARHAAAGLAIARRLDNPHTLAHALALHCRFVAMADDIANLRATAEELAALAAEHGFPFYAAAADIYRGWVLAGRDLARGLAMMHESLEAFAALGATALRPWFWGRIAELSASAGKNRDAVDLLDRALEQIDRSGQRWCEAELKQAKARLQAGRSHTGRAADVSCGLSMAG